MLLLTFGGLFAGFCYCLLHAGGHGGGFGGFPMLLDVPVQVHHNQFKSLAPVEKVFKAIPVQVKVAESQETGGHGGGGGGHNGWH